MNKIRLKRDKRFLSVLPYFNKLGNFEVILIVLIHFRYKVNTMGAFRLYKEWSCSAEIKQQKNGWMETKTHEKC